MTSPSSPGDVFAGGVAEGRLRFQWCDECSKPIFYPRVLCPACGSQSLRWCDSSGRGAIYAHTWVANRGGGYSVALVDLDDGFRMMSSVVGAEPDVIRTGMRVTSAVDVADGVPRLIFCLDGGPS